MLNLAGNLAPRRLFCSPRSQWDQRKWWKALAIVTTGAAVTEGFFIWRKKNTLPNSLFTLANDQESAAIGVSQCWKLLKTSATITVADESTVLPPRSSLTTWKQVVFNAIGAPRLSTHPYLRSLLEDESGLTPVDISPFLKELSSHESHCVLVEGVEGSGKTTALRAFVWSEVAHGRPAVYIHWGELSIAGHGPRALTFMGAAEIAKLGNQAVELGTTVTVVIDDVNRSHRKQVLSLLETAKSSNLRVILATSDFRLSEKLSAVAPVVRINPPDPPQLRQLIMGVHTTTQPHWVDYYCDVVRTYSAMNVQRENLQTITLNAFNHEVAQLYPRLSHVLKTTKAPSAGLKQALLELCNCHYLLPINEKQRVLCRSLVSAGILRPGNPERDWYEFRDCTVQAAVRAVLEAPLTKSRSNEKGEDSGIWASLKAVVGALGGLQTEEQKGAKELCSGMRTTLRVLSQGIVGFERTQKQVLQLLTEVEGKGSGEVKKGEEGKAREEVKIEDKKEKVKDKTKYDKKKEKKEKRKIKDKKKHKKDKKVKKDKESKSDKKEKKEKKDKTEKKEEEEKVDATSS